MKVFDTLGPDFDALGYKVGFRTFYDFNRSNYKIYLCWLKITNGTIR